jgi:hypothetical protein
MSVLPEHGLTSADFAAAGIFDTCVLARPTAGIGDLPGGAEGDVRLEF